MGFFDKFRPSFWAKTPPAALPPAEEQRSGMTLTQNEMIRLLSGQTFSGIPQSEEEVLKISPAFAAIGYISTSLASLPFSVYKRTESGQKMAENHPVFALFAGRPHPLYTKYQFFQTLVANALLGDGYARIHFGADMRPYALEILPASGVLPQMAADGSLYYQVSGLVNGRATSVALADWEVLHIKSLSWNGIRGVQLRAVHADTLGMASAAQQYSRNFFENGAHITGYLKVPGELPGTGSADKLRKEFMKAAGGIGNAGTVPVLDSNTDFVKVGLNPGEAAVMDFRKLTVQDCARIWRVPMHLLGDLDRSSFSNIEQQNADFLTYTLMPLISQIEDELDTKLFTAQEIRARRYRTAFDMSAFQRADTKSQAEFYATMAQNGIMSRNEIRAKFNLNPMDGGDTLTIQLNMADLTQIGQPVGEPAPGIVPAAVADPTPQPAAANGN